MPPRRLRYRPTLDHLARFLQGIRNVPLDRKLELSVKMAELGAIFPGDTNGRATFDIPRALAHYHLPPLEDLHRDQDEALWRAAHLIAHYHVHGGAPCSHCWSWVRTAGVSVRLPR